MDLFVSVVDSNRVVTSVSAPVGRKRCTYQAARSHDSSMSRNLRGSVWVWKTCISSGWVGGSEWYRIFDIEVGH